MLLTGHSGEIYCAKFHPAGNLLASAGFERNIFLWTVYGECDNINVMTGHTGAIVQLCFNQSGDNLYTASTDKTVGMFDSMTGQRIKRMKGHTSYVNSVDCARHDKPLVVSGGDDCQIKVWDPRRRQAVTSLNNDYQVTAVQFNEDPTQIITGGIDNDLKIWDTRKNAIVAEMKGHTDTVTGMQLSPDGCHILTNAMDNTLRVWDSRPFCTGERCVKVFTGHNHNFGRTFSTAPGVLTVPWLLLGAPTGMSTSGTSTPGRLFINFQDTWAASMMWTSTRLSPSFSAQDQTSRF